MDRIIETKTIGAVRVELVRSSLGQVTEYEVYFVEGKSRMYKGSGTKAEARKIFDQIVKAYEMNPAKFNQLVEDVESGALGL
jgi:hypothetical protein